MSNLTNESHSKPRRRRIGPVIVGILFFLAACGISLDFLAEQFGANRDLASVEEAVPVEARVQEFVPNVATLPNVDVSDSAGRDSIADPFVDDMSMVGPDSPIGRSDSKLPFPNPWPNEVRHRGKKMTAGGSGNDPADEPFAMARGQARAPAQFDYESAPEDLKISTEPSMWKGVPQLLPAPMYVRQLKDRRALDIRGGGWVMIDVNKSQIIDVELFKSIAKSVNEQRVIEAKYLNGAAIVNPNSAGFVIARGVPGTQPGGFEVFENPPCLTRFANVSSEEICEVIVKGIKSRFKFTPPVVPAEGPAPDFIFSTVSFDMGPLGWKRIISFNESFHSIGDPNRDGYPDFIVESVTGYDESGVHVLLMSHPHDDIVEYEPHTARFNGR